MSIQNSIVQTLSKMIDEQLAEEGITPAVIDAVMLDVAYSPVIPVSGGGTRSAVEVRPWGFYPDDVVPTKFELPDGRVVDQEPLKVMRARYLVARGREMQPQLDAWLKKHGLGGEESA